MRNVHLLLAALLVAVLASTVAAQAPPPKKFYKEWKMDDLLASVKDLGSGHDWAKGRQLFRKTACGVCHAFGSESEGIGLAPDLTAVASKYTRDVILQSILEPSATLNGQYFHTTFTLKSGTQVTGSIVETLDKKIVVAPLMMNPQVTVEVAVADVKSEAPSAVSPMPAGLLNELTREEIVELLAFLESGGDRNAPIYSRKK
jgi:putative heme-binding domain-containing protein